MHFSAVNNPRTAVNEGFTSFFFFSFLLSHVVILNERENSNSRHTLQFGSSLMSPECTRLFLGYLRWSFNSASTKISLPVLE